MSRPRGLAALSLLFVVLAFLVPAPAGVTPQGWRQTAIFLCVIVGMIVEPLPASALLGLTATVAPTAPRCATRWAGLRSPRCGSSLRPCSSRALLDSGLARRIALFFLRAFGRSSLGVPYAVQMTDVTLASGMPSITARSAGMVLPVPVSIAEQMARGRARRRTGSADS